MTPPEEHTGNWRVKLVLHYEGRNFHGWQVQRNQRTVQGELSSLLGRLCEGFPIKVTGAGRTDSGVHATGQVASTLLPPRWTPEALRRALNALAPSDLWIASAERVSLCFHPRYHATSRTYVYRVGVGPEARSPFHIFWCWPFGHPLDLKPMREAATAIVGRHDFSAFAKAGQPERGVTCQVIEASWGRRTEAAEMLEFEVTADRYLHRMVRYLVGTMVEIGAGRRPIDDLEQLLRGTSERPTAPPAPPQGLFLTRVDYSKALTNNEASRSNGEAE